MRTLPLPPGYWLVHFNRDTFGSELLDEACAEYRADSGFGCRSVGFHPVKPTCSVRGSAG